MSEKEQIVKLMKKYIDTHILEPITALDIAKSVGYSQFHVARIFKKQTGYSPFEYLRQQRLICAAYELRRTNKRVVDVAFDFIFDSHEGFARAFGKAFGISPKRFATYTVPNGWLIPFSISRHNYELTEDKNMDNTAVIFTQVIDRPERKLILKRSKNADEYGSYCEEVGCGDEQNPAPWDILCGIKEALYEPVGLWLPENMRPNGTGIYAHGVEVAIEYSGEIPDGFDVITLPACKMLVFQGEPYNDEDYARNVGDCMDRIEKFNPQVYGFKYAPEVSPKMQLAPMGWRGYIEMRPVVQIN